MTKFLNTTPDGRTDWDDYNTVLYEWRRYLSNMKIVTQPLHFYRYLRRLHTEQEIADHLGVQRSTVKQWGVDDRVPAKHLKACLELARGEPFGEQPFDPDVLAWSARVTSDEKITPRALRLVIDGMHLTIAEAADLCGCSYVTFYQRTRNGCKARLVLPLINRLRLKLGLEPLTENVDLEQYRERLLTVADEADVTRWIAGETRLPDPIRRWLKIK